MKARSLEELRKLIGERFAEEQGKKRPKPKPKPKSPPRARPEPPPPAESKPQPPAGVRVASQPEPRVEPVSPPKAEPPPSPQAQALEPKEPKATPVVEIVPFEEEGDEPGDAEPVETGKHVPSWGWVLLGVLALIGFFLLLKRLFGGPEQGWGRERKPAPPTMAPPPPPQPGHKPESEPTDEEIIQYWRAQFGLA